MSIKNKLAAVLGFVTLVAEQNSYMDVFLALATQNERLGESGSSVSTTLSGSSGELQQELNQFKAG